MVLFSDFIKVLSKVKDLILLDTYSAGEKVIKGAQSEDIYLKLLRSNKKVRYFKNINKLNKILLEYTSNKNMIIFMGAGSISNIARNLLNNVKKLIELSNKIKSNIYLDYDIGKKTWFRTGGKAKVFVLLEDVSELNNFK